ncbi:hypothetical protein ACWKYH_06830 [Enterobacter sp. UPMP2076]
MGFRYIKGDWKDFYEAPDEAMLLVADSYHRQYFVDIFPEAGGKYWSYLSSHGKWGAGVKPEDFTVLAVRERIAEWNGEGLPPVGLVVEVSVDGGRTWCSYKAISEHNGMRLVEIGNFTEEFQENNWTFRPIRSEADKKRDEAVTALHDEYFSHAPIDKVRDVLYELYDAIAAGKIPHIRID